MVCLLKVATFSNVLEAVQDMARNKQCRQHFMECVEVELFGASSHTTTHCVCEEEDRVSVWEEGYVGTAEVRDEQWLALYFREGVKVVYLGALPHIDRYVHERWGEGMWVWKEGRVGMSGRLV